MRRISGRPSPAMAVAFIALLAALSGTAVALPGKNTVDSGDIIKANVKKSDIAKNAVNSTKVKDGSLLAQDFKSGQLPAGPKGDIGPKGDKGDTGAPGAPGAPGSTGRTGRDERDPADRGLHDQPRKPGRRNGELPSR